MKRKRRLLPLIIIAVLLIGIAVFAYVQRGNINALIMSMRYSDEDLQSLQSDARRQLIEKFGLDPEVLERIDSQATVSPTGDSDAAEILLPGTDPESEQTPAQSEAPGNPDDPIIAPPSGGKAPELPKGTDKLPADVQKLVYSLYSLQSQYLGRLDGIRAAAVARYQALPESEKGSSAQVSIAKSGVSQAMSLEGQCDGKVASLLSELRASLRRHGLDESLADSVEDYYATQKGLVKAEYMRKYNKYLK